MSLKIDWGKFVTEVLTIAPAIVATVAQDKAAFSHESKTDAAAQATMQASQIAQALDPKDADTIAAASAVAKGIITALKTPPPA